MTKLEVDLLSAPKEIKPKNHPSSKLIRTSRIESWMVRSKMTTEETNKFFLDALNFAIHQLVNDGSLTTTAVVMTAGGEYSGCKLQFSDAKSKSVAIASFVAELKEQKPPCAVIVVPISTSASRGKKRKTSLCVAFQSSQNKFVSMVNYEHKKNGEFVFETPYFCNDNEIILSGHEYFGDAFDLEYK